MLRENKLEMNMCSYCISTFIYMHIRKDLEGMLTVVICDEFPW